jgi:hypothetical protein
VIHIFYCINSDLHCLDFIIESPYPEFAMPKFSLSKATCLLLKNILEQLIHDYSYIVTKGFDFLNQMS